MLSADAQQSSNTTNDDDPFSSPSQIAHMWAFCRSYMRWLLPGIDIETADRLLNDRWNCSRDPMLLAACCLASVGHLDAVQPNRSGGDYSAYRARVLQELSERIRVPSTAVADRTVRTLTCLLSFELSKGNPEATTHLRGLSSILDAKGAVNAPGIDEGLLMVVEYSDLIHSAMFDTTPILTAAEPGSGDSTTDAGRSKVDLFEYVISLLVSEQQDLQLGYKTKYSRKLQEVPQLLLLLLTSATSALRCSTDSSKTRAIHQDDEDHMLLLRDGLDRFGQQSIRGSNEIDDSHQLARACHLSLILFYKLAINNIPYRHISNQRDCQWLCNAVRKVNDSTWPLVPYLRLWMLMTGTMTSTCQTEKSYFKAETVRAIFHIGVSGWPKARQFMTRFMETKRALEQSSRRGPPPSEEGVSMTPMQNLQSTPTWNLTSRETQLPRKHSLMRSEDTRTSTELGFGSPYSSCASNEVPPLSQLETSYDTKLDPFQEFAFGEDMFAMSLADDMVQEQFNAVEKTNSESSSTGDQLDLGLFEDQAWFMDEEL